MEYRLSAGIILPKEPIKLVELITTESNTSFLPVEAISNNISWIKETESYVTLTYKNKEIKKYSTYNDYHGYKTSIKFAIEHAKEIEGSYGIDNLSGLEVNVFTIFVEIPVIILDKGDQVKKIKYKEVIDRGNYYIDDDKYIKKLMALLKKPFNDRTSEDFEEMDKLNGKLKLNYKRTKPVKSWGSVSGKLLED